MRLKTAFKRQCFKARQTAWRDFVTTTGNSEPWGPVYNWLKTVRSRPSERLLAAIRKADGTYTTSLRKTGERLIEALVPSDSYDCESPEQIALRAEMEVYVGTFTETRNALRHIEP